MDAEHQDDAGRVSLILQRAARDGESPLDELLPLVYRELQGLARSRLRQLPAGATLQPTVLVHEAYVRLASEDESDWSCRAHFFAAAGEAMRKILVEHARRRWALKRGGDRQRVDVDEADWSFDASPEEILALDEALARLEEEDAELLRIVRLRYFSGLTAKQTAEVLGIPLRSFHRRWSFAVAWMRREMASFDPKGLTDRP